MYNVLQYILENILSRMHCRMLLYNANRKRKPILRRMRRRKLPHDAQICIFLKKRENWQNVSTLGSFLTNLFSFSEVGACFFGLFSRQKGLGQQGFGSLAQIFFELRMSFAPRIRSWAVGSLVERKCCFRPVISLVFMVYAWDNISTPGSLRKG